MDRGEDTAREAMSTIVLYDADGNIVHVGENVPEFDPKDDEIATGPSETEKKQRKTP